MTKTICITGSAGNLGSLTAQHLFNNSDWELNLMVHHRPFRKAMKDDARVKIYKCDLNKKETLEKCLEDVDEIIHYAGILFASNPEEFLPKTNTKYFQNLVDVAKSKAVKRIVLISFPHVEGYTSTQFPSTHKMDQVPVSIHATTRLEEERYLQANFKNFVILRVGMVYGRGILMPDAARWFAKRNLLGVWKEQTLIHLISKEDYLNSVFGVIMNEMASGVYNIGDDGIQTLQEYLDFACKQWGCKKPWRMPLWLIYLAAWIFEFISRVFRTKSPLTKDFIDIGRVSYYGDTTRMRDELLPSLKYPTMKDGKNIF
ncbi:MAG: NAD(P)-dependent oxidoreductase [Bacteroidetes bacterium]|nr:NAD(P)-dependent oxidoreductase [Bacteroidota bacterium]